MDWWQVFYSFIGSFLGFGFALLAEGIVTKLRNNKKLIRLIENLNDELNKAVRGAYFDEEGQSIKDDRAFFATPIWDSVVSSGDLLVLQKKNPDYYNNILATYSKVSAIGQMEEQSEYYDELIKQGKKNVIELIDLIRSEVRNGR